MPLLVALAWAAPARGQSCYASSATQYYSDLCDTTTFGQTYEFNQALSSFFTNQSGAAYLLACTNSDVGIYDASNPGSMSSALVTAHIPWDWTTIKNADTHAQMMSHILDVATLDVDAAFPYALVSLGNYGWDFLKLNGGNSKFLAHGFKPVAVLASAYVSAAMLKDDNGNVYVAAQALDSNSIASQDYSVRIYQIGGRTATGATINTDTLTFATMGQLSTIVPIGHAGDGAYDNTHFRLALGYRFYVLTDASPDHHRLLLVKSNSTAVVVNIDDPRNPYPVELTTQTDLVGGNWGVDATRHVVWVGSSSQTVVNGYRVDSSQLPFASSFAHAYTNINYDATDGHATGVVPPGTGVAVSGDLLTAFSVISGAPSYQLGSRVGYISLAGPAPTLLGPQTPYTDLDPAHVCQNAAYVETIQDARPFQVGGNYYASLSLAVDAMVVGINGSCMSTTPVAAFTATRSNPTSGAASCPNGSATTPPTPIVARGFSGDTFNITNTSNGLVASGTLAIAPVSGAGVVGAPIVGPLSFPPTGTGSSQPWTTSGFAPGEYQITVTASAPSQPTSTTTGSIFLCPETAGITLTGTPTSVLVNSQLTADAGATVGNPTGYDFYVMPSTQSTGLTPSLSGTSKTYPFSLQNCGSYKVGVVAHYNHAGNTDNCAAFPWYAGSGGSDECAETNPVSAGLATASMAVTQGSATLATAPAQSTASPLVTSPVTLSANVAIASGTGYTPSYLWQIANVSACLTRYAPSPCSDTGSSFTPANLVAGTPVAFNLHVALSPTPAPTDPCASSATIDLPMTLSPVNVTADISVSATTVKIGEVVTFTVTGVSPPGAFSSLAVDLGGATSCTNTQKVPLCTPPATCVNGAPATTSFASSAGGSTWQVQLTGTVAQGGAVWNGPVKPITVTNTGTCVQPLTTFRVAPNPGTTGKPVTFTFAPVVNAGDTLTFTYGDGTTDSVKTNLCSMFGGCTWQSHTYTSAGPYSATADGVIGGLTYHGGPITVTIDDPVVVPPPPPPPPPPTNLLTIRPNPNPATAGQVVTFTFSPSLSRNGDYLNFNFGPGQTPVTLTYAACNAIPGGLACGQTSNTYATTGTFAVTASGTAGGVAVSGSTSVAVTQVCTLPAAPTAAFTYSAPTLKAQFTDMSSGGPTSWSWNFGDGTKLSPAGTSSAQNPAYTFGAAGTYTVTLTATNCKGSNQSQRTITVSSCTQTAVPTASFTWPTGAVDGFPEQQQPYVGQQVTLTDTSSNSPTSWHWYDFNELAVNQTVTRPTFTFTWPANLPAGAKNVRMTATNCVGTSAEVANTVTIYPDVRHVVADFSWSSGTLATGAPVTLVAAQGPSYGDPDQFTWTFDDGTQDHGASIQHTFTCAGARTVTLKVGRSNYPTATATAWHTLTLTGQQCGPESVMTVDAAQLPGVNDTYWRTNVRLFNPSPNTSQITVEFRPIGWGNNTAGATIPVNPYATLVLDDVIAWGRQQGLFGTDVKKAALRILFNNPAGVAPVVTSETYTTPSTGSGAFGQLNPGIEVVPNNTQPVLWITGIRNNGPTAGFRTNYSVLNLRNTAVSNVLFTLLDPTGKSLATQSVNLGAYEYRQDSLANLFGGSSAATSQDPLAVKVEVPAESDLQAYTSVVDNLTGDPVLIPAVPPPAAPIFLPAVAYTPGVNGTVWRSDLQLTNPDSAPHTWALTYTPGGGQTLPIVTQKPTIAAQSTVRYDDLLSWLYGGTLTDATKTSGVVEITPADGSGVYPIVQARSFNQTGNGTFGQNIPPVTPDMGVVAGQGKRLLLTGMSSQDIARTNLGFVSLSDTAGVNFSVMFYDESGNVLNGKDGQGNPVPYTFALGPDGWDQDKLENRFHNAGWSALPSNLRAISAVIRVTDGGPGTVYATVIDNLTGDPNFILAQPAP